MKKLGILLLAAGVGLCTNYASAEFKVAMQNISGSASVYCDIFAEAYSGPIRTLSPIYGMSSEVGGGWLLSEYKCYVNGKPVTSSSVGGWQNLCIVVKPTEAVAMPAEQCHMK